MKSMLENIKQAVSNINWNSETKKQKALNLCISIYNLYIYEGGDFYSFRQLSKEYFLREIKTMNYVYGIKNELINSGILEIYFGGTTTGTYDVTKGKAKGYRFNQQLINGNYVVLSGTKSIKHNNEVVLSGTKSVLQNIEISNININNLLNISRLYHICGTKLESYINKGLQNITFEPKVYEFINNFSLKRNDILVDEEIEDDFVNIKFENDDYNYSIEKAIQLKDKLNKNIIKYKDNCYIENVDDFLIRKTNDLKLIFKKNIFDIENKLFRISRNDTNYRLDYNLTNMKSDLLNFIKLDNESIIELDISNAQFAILCNITEDLDINFKELCITGQLYSFISKELNITKEEAKNKMFRVAFDKVKKEQDDIRNLFPTTMKFIDYYKKKFGYKSFSNLLQVCESGIMIDGLMNHLMDKFQVFPIHDAIRVKESELELVKNEIKLYFNKLEFKCDLRNKKEINEESITEDIKVSEIEDNDDWFTTWAPKKRLIEKDYIDDDFGDSDGIDGFIESIDFD